MLTRGALVSGAIPTPAHLVRPQDVAALAAYLQTPNDNGILNEDQFSNPFK